MIENGSISELIAFNEKLFIYSILYSLLFLLILLIISRKQKHLVKAFGLTVGIFAVPVFIILLINNNIPDERNITKYPIMAILFYPLFEELLKTISGYFSNKIGSSIFFVISIFVFWEIVIVKSGLFYFYENLIGNIDAEQFSYFFVVAIIIPSIFHVFTAIIYHNAFKFGWKYCFVVCSALHIIFNESRFIYFPEAVGVDVFPSIVVDLTWMAALAIGIRYFLQRVRRLDRRVFPVSAEPEEGPSAS